jgi:hypothetical protein
MTWIIGTAAYWGAAVLVSDIRVTFVYPDGREEHEDFLQKIYPLGRQVIGGFSGSVTIGFQIVDALKNDIAHLSKNAACNINILANKNWPRLARHIFEKSEKGEKDLGSEIIIASAHPQLNFGETQFARINIHIFRAPEFKPFNVERNKVVSIGNGSVVAPYMDFLATLERDRSLVQLGANSPRSLASTISFRMMRTIETYPEKFISKYLQFGIVRRDEATVANMDFIGSDKPLMPFHTYHERPAGTVTQVKLSPLVKNLKDFENYRTQRKRAACKATC